MSVQFLLGPSGSGKSTKILNRIISESIENSDKLYYLIVPEQYTMEAQRDIVTMHPSGGTMNIDAIGFNRLAYRIFDELSINPGDVLMDFGKSMLIKKILWDKRDELLVYGSYMDKLGFIDEMKSMISELFQYAIRRTDIENVIEETETSDFITCSKLKDIKLIYETLENYMAGSYIVAEQLVQLLTQHVCRSDIIKKSYLFFDGFTGFTPVQLGLVRELIKYAKGVTFAFTIDTNDISLVNIKEHELFYMTKTALLTLADIAADEGIEILPNILMDDRSICRFKNNIELGFLERQLFRYPYAKYDDSLHNIGLTSCDCARDEIYYIAGEIKRLIGEGYRYKDIAVVTGDLDSTAEYYSRIMKEYDIPIFVDANILMKSNPCSETIRSLVDMYSSGFSYDGVFRFLKMGMTDMTSDDIEYLENYAIKRGLRGYASWNREVPEYFEENAVRSIEKIRADFMELLVDITPVFMNKNSTVRDYVEAVYNFLLKIDMYGRLMKKSDSLREQGRYDEMDSYSRIMDKVVVLFDKIVSLLGDEHMSLKEFGDIIDAGLSDIEIGIVPPTIDRVLIGDITRSRLNHIKVLFLAGANDGIIPKAEKKGKILIDSDRRVLSEHGLVLAPSDKINAYAAQFYLYLNITKPSDRLFISYRRKDSDDRELRTSYIVSRIKNIFPKLEEKSFNMNDEKMYTEEAVLRYISGCVQNGDMQSVPTCLISLLRERGCEKEVDSLYAGSRYINDAETLTKAAVKLLYGNELVQSVSKLEAFAKCSYAYFLKYGLRLKERDRYDIDVRHVGSILHKVMEKVFNEVRNTFSNDWSMLDDGRREELVENALKAAASEYGGTFFEDYARNGYMLKLLEHMARYSVKTLQSHISYGDMKPSMIEKVFDSEYDELPDYIFNLENDMRMIVGGKIDRVDTCMENDEVYIKIIDYKSSSKDLSLDRILSGLQLQLCAYSGIAYELEKKIYPDKNIRLGGLLYYSFDDPVIEMSSLSIDDTADGFLYEEAVKEKRLEASKLKGFVNEDKTIMARMDRTLTTSLPVKLDRQGEPKKSRSILNEKQLLKLIEYTRKNMEKLGNRIASGVIDINPYKVGKETGCDYCSFKGICRFDTKYGKNSYRTPDEAAVCSFYEENEHGENKLD